MQTPKRYIRFTTKLRILFILFTVVPVLIMGVFTLYGIRHMMESTLVSQKSTELKYINQSLNDMLLRYESLLDSLQEEPVLLQFLVDETGQAYYYELNDYLYLRFSGMQTDCSAHVVSCRWDSATGTAETSTEFRYPRNTRNWGPFREENRDLTQYISINDLHDAQFADGMFSVIRPVHDGEGVLVGYIILNINQNAMRSIIINNENQYNTPVYLYSSTGFVVYSSNPKVGLGRGQLPDYVQADDGSQRALRMVNERSGLTLAIEVPMSIIQQEQTSILRVMATVMALCLLVGILVSHYLARYISQPLRQTLNGIQELERGNFDNRLQVTSGDEFGEVMRSFNYMTDQLQTHILQAEERAHTLRIAEIEKLQAQLKTHFLYNILDLIRWEARAGKTGEIECIVLNLARFMRASLDVGRTEHTVREEMDILSSYVEIWKFMMDGLTMTFDIAPEVLDAQIPRLLLQPLLENSIRHGLHANERHGVIDIRGERLEKGLRFTVRDNGCGIPTDTLARLNQGEAGVGLANVRKRALLYGGPGSGTLITSVEGEGTSVTIYIEDVPGRATGGTVRQ